MRRGLAVMAMLLLLISRGSAQDSFRPGCGTYSAGSSSVRAANDIGGRHLPSSGNLHILVVFASFPDDETPHPFWPAHQAPLFMRDFIDPDTLTRSQSSSNLTNYFRQMSLGQFHLTGDVLWVESARPKTEYLNGAFGRANENVLREKVDSLVDFARYDHWTNNADDIQSNVPDGLVDMIVMVWRTNIFESVGDASLGAGRGAADTGYVLDGKRIGTGFPEYFQAPAGSGVTCEYLYGDTPVKLRKTMAHELSHWLLGGQHPYDTDAFLGGKHAFWGMLCDGNREASCANAYEREQLGWITVPEIPRDTNLTLDDYVTTGAAFKYHPPNGDPSEYFYFENHRNLSVFDDVSRNTADTGLWILHQQGPYMGMNNLRIAPSDGNWQWQSAATTSACFGQPLPLFVRGAPNVVNGLSHRDMLSTPQSALNWMYASPDSAGQTQCGAMFAGEFFTGAFTPEGSPVFSPWSNPSSAAWSKDSTGFALEVLGRDAAGLHLRAFTHPLDASPARRYLGLDPGIDQVSGLPIALAWGTQWSGGQTIEPDIDSSEVQRCLAGSGAWSTVYRGTNTVCRDTGTIYDTNGALLVSFRARVRNGQGKFSAWSPLLTLRASGVCAVKGGAEGTVPARFALEQNYPNPFNPSTTIRYSLPARALVKLSVYDVVGREVAQLVNGESEIGNREVRFDGAGLASGVYVCRLQAGAFTAFRKMVLVR